MSSPTSQKCFGVLVGRSIDFVGVPRFVCDECGQIKEFEPQSRYLKASESTLHKYGSGCFCKFRVCGLENRAGAYLMVNDGAVVYVGRTKDMKRRFAMGYGNISPKNCFEGGQQTNCRINKLILESAKKGLEFRFLVIYSEEYVLLEKELITRLRPEWNIH